MTYAFTPVSLVPVKIGEGHYEMRYKIDLRPRFTPIPAQRCPVTVESAAVAKAKAKLAAERLNYTRRNHPDALNVSTDWKEHTRYGRRGTW